MNNRIVIDQTKWPKRFLGDVSEVFVGMPLSRHPVAEGNVEAIPVINVRDLDDGRVIDPAHLEVRTQPRGDTPDRYRVRAGDVVITCRGTQLKIARISIESNGMAISANLIAIRTGPELLPPVLFAYLNSPNGRAALMGRSRSSTLSLALSAKSIGRIRVPVPPMEAQRQIADLVGAAEDNYTLAIHAASRRRAIAHEVATRMLMGEFDSKANNDKRFI